MEKVSSGDMSVDDALLRLRMEPFQDLGFAKVDHHRGLRQGVPEVIYGAGKTPEQIISIVKALEGRGRPVIVTRLEPSSAETVSKEVDLDYHADCRIGVVGPIPEERIGRIAVVAAGTSDIPVAEEAALTAELLGNNVVRVYDVGVAGMHRLLSSMEEVMTARVVIAVAGMEGALASVVGGMVDCPVVAVPTSVGYGASFGGLAALLAMMNSCASGVGVVNIDNGFGAGYLAGTINRMRSP